jgi:hypothetical protein
MRDEKEARHERLSLLLRMAASWADATSSPFDPTAYGDRAAGSLSHPARPPLTVAREWLGQHLRLLPVRPAKRDRARSSGHIPHAPEQRLQRLLPGQMGVTRKLTMDLCIR